MHKYLFIFLAVSHLAHASHVDYRSESRREANDYLFGTGRHLADPVFDKFRTIDLNVDIGIGSDCGRINIHKTLKAGLENILDSKYFEKVGQDIMAASPMLLTCYFSPTWCAILKNFRIQANFLAQLRLNQCNAINKYTDQRVSDYYEQRSQCVQGKIKDTNGNFEEAMAGCDGAKDFNLKSWSGGNGKDEENRLIEDTAKWAGFSDEQSKRVVDLTKSFIGDTIVKNGSIKVDFGPRQYQMTPRTYLMEVRASTFEKLCNGLLPKLVKSGAYGSSVYRVISDKELADVSGSNKVTLDRQTLVSLAYLPYNKRKDACRQLSEALAMGTYTEDMSKTIDFISSKLSTNPHLPEKRKSEVDLKRRAFKDQIELTLDFESRYAEPLHQVLYRINQEGAKYIGKDASREVMNEGQSHHSKRMRNLFMDCADGIGCEK